MSPCNGFRQTPLPQTSTKFMFWTYITDDDQPMAHAAMETDKYHISFVVRTWPYNETLGQIQTRFPWPVSPPELTKVPSAMVYHYGLDLIRHKPWKPLILFETSYFSNAKINEAYEKALKYNGVSPESVTINKGQEMLESCQEPMVNLTKTLYTLWPSSKHGYQGFCW